MFQGLGGQASARRVSHKLCFRQAHCFMQGPLRFLPVPQIPHVPAPTYGAFRLSCGPQTPEARGDEILKFRLQDME